MSTFEPIKVGKSFLSNRLVVAPLTRIRAVDHTPDEVVTEHYRQVAAGEPGSLIITESTCISPQASGITNVPGIWDAKHVAAWKLVTNAVHEEKSFTYSQLWALGRQASADVLAEEGPYSVVAPSAIAQKGGAEPRALTKDEIKEYVGWYAQAAKNAIEAGFDGVEIHGANGQLPDQFLHENSNHRTDEYGGSIENRARFTLEVVDAIVAAIGADRTGIRFSPWGDFGDVDYGISPIPQWSYLTAELERRAQNGQRLSYIHITEPRVEVFEDVYKKIDHSPNNFFRDIWQGILIRAGGFGKDYDDIKQLQTEDDKLLIAIGRLSISNPDFIAKIKAGKPLELYDRSTFYWDTKIDKAIGYTKNFVRTAD